VLAALDSTSRPVPVLIKPLVLEIRPDTVSASLPTPDPLTANVRDEPPRTRLGSITAPAGLAV
jgi:hypothetical protein